MTETSDADSEGMYYQIWKSSHNNQWYWHLKSANNEPIAASEGYVNRAGALHAIQLVKSSADAPLYDGEGKPTS